MAGPTAEPRWLDADEMQTWLAITGLFIRLPAALDGQLRRDAGISHFDYQILAMLSTSEDHSLRMSDLAAITHSSLSRLSHATARLEAREWVIRAPDPSDGRFTTAALTGAGMNQLAASAPGHVAAVRRYVFDALTTGQAHQLRVIAERILTIVE